MSDNAIAENVRRRFRLGGQTYHYYSLPAAQEAGYGEFSRLPYSLKVLLECILRKGADQSTFGAINAWLENGSSSHEINYFPARVLMQDFTGVPAVVDLAAMRDAMAKLGQDPELINPQNNVDLVIDHSVQVDHFGNAQAFSENVAIEMSRNRERYEFLRWGQTAFKNFRVVPPGTGICHQVNLEYLAKVVWSDESQGDSIVVYPDTLVGTDSHTTMINGLGVLGWGVGGIEAEAAMLGQHITMQLPEVIGFRLSGRLREGVTATDLVLTIVQMLRQYGVVGKFVEFFGPGLTDLPVADRATIANMAPEYGATCGFFPVDERTIDYLRLTGRKNSLLDLVQMYSKEQGLWRDNDTPDPVFTDVLELDLDQVEPSLAGPKRPQDRVALSELAQATATVFKENNKQASDRFAVANQDYQLSHGDVVIAAITSCTNTSNPNVLLAAGLLAKKAVQRGLKTKPWVKTSLAPGSKVVTEYLEKATLQQHLDTLGFGLVGYGCTTCIGNSGPLDDDITQAIVDNDIVVSAVLSGNRNFEGRIHPLTKANWLASPPLVVAYALAGTTHINLAEDPLGTDSEGKPVFLKEIWPTAAEIEAVGTCIDKSMFREQYADVFSGDQEWRRLDVAKTKTYQWDTTSTYVQNPPYFEDLSMTPKPPQPITGARILALLGDSITTDHISPAGAIKADSPAGSYLQSRGVEQEDFNSYGARRGNHEVMMRGTFANIRIRNEMAPGTEGGYTCYIPDDKIMSIYDAAMSYQKTATPLVVIAGKEYGTGSSRDWAAKGTLLLGVKAVIAESFERIHRSNLIGMGVLPLQFIDGMTRQTLKLTGKEIIDIHDISLRLKAGQTLQATIHYADRQEKISLLCRIDTEDEAFYYLQGGILQTVLRKLAQ